MTLLLLLVFSLLFIELPPSELSNCSSLLFLLSQLLIFPCLLLSTGGFFLCLQFVSISKLLFFPLRLCSIKLIVQLASSLYESALLFLAQLLFLLFFQHLILACSVHYEARPMTCTWQKRRPTVFHRSKHLLKNFGNFLDMITLSKWKTCNFELETESQLRSHFRQSFFLL